MIGRKTIPIVHPTLAAPTLALALMTWAVGLAYLWHTNFLVTAASNILSLWVGVCYMTSSTVKEYQRSFYLYNVGDTVSSF